jgi:hypothetical protein
MSHAPVVRVDREDGARSLGAKFRPLLEPCFYSRPTNRMSAFKPKVEKEIHVSHIFYVFWFLNLSSRGIDCVCRQPCFEDIVGGHVHLVLVGPTKTNPHRVGRSTSFFQNTLRSLVDHCWISIFSYR